MFPEALYTYNIIEYFSLGNPTSPAKDEEHSFLKEELQEQIHLNKQNTLQIKELVETVRVLSDSLESSKQWQASVYNQMQRMTEFNNEMSKRLAELYAEVKSLKSSTENPPSEIVSTKSATKTQGAVVYGGSTSSKKIAQRRKLTNSSISFSDKQNNTNKTLLEKTTKLVKTAEIKSSTEDFKATTSLLKEDETHALLQEEKQTSPQTNNSPSSPLLNIEETLRQAAEEALVKSGFAYDETSGMYYNWESKMYYDPNNKLYYDHENGIYYYYDQEKESYIFHSQVTIPTATENTTDATSSPKTDADELSDGEIRSGPASPVVVDPCIRVMIVKSDSVDVGTLHMITCQGGSIGRDPSNTICLPEELVSRHHAKIIYEKESTTFFIKDLKTQNGTLINDERVADPKSNSDPVEVTHRDFIQVGDTVMSFHVHVGNETCFDCEPGNIQAILEAQKPVEVKEDLSKQRKHEVKSMMKKYGLSKGYIPKKLIESVPDRAERRRKEVGSDAYENSLKPVEKASVHKEISENNIGHKMLAKMGWKSGEGLGKTQQGIAQPIGVQVHAKSKGLGFGQTSSIDSKPSRKQEILNKTKERFDKIN